MAMFAILFVTMLIVRVVRLLVSRNYASSQASDFFDDVLQGLRNTLGVDDHWV